ncbi:MAG: hypothetical protein FWD93_03320, partial [Coriobacteriia bacterium]|nr:hypothetical protein [Coriobacteriia bacterium]
LISRGGGVYLLAGNFTMGALTPANATITNNRADAAGGVWIGDAVGTRSMAGSSSVTNNHAVGSSGGGIYLWGSSPFAMGNTSSITGNHANHRGGGIFVAAGAVTLSDTASVSTNHAANGAGIALHGSASLALNAGTTVNGNIATQSGGGILADETNTVTMTGNTLNLNSASNGGGIWLSAGSGLTATNTSFTNNVSTGTASTSGGGAIFTANFDNGNPLPLLTEYSNLTLNNVAFTGNSANSTHPPADNAASLTNIGFSSVSTSWHPLNNRDINYINSNPFIPSAGLWMENAGGGMRIFIAAIFVGLVVWLTLRYRRHKEEELVRLKEIVG